MALQSMTGFSRSEGVSGRYRWAWELRSVNGKGLDVKLRLPPGLEALEPTVRQGVAAHMTRGNLQVGLSAGIGEAAVQPVINRAALATVLSLHEQLDGLIDPAPLRLDTLLAVRGIVEFREPDEAPDEKAARDAEILAGFHTALDAMVRMRESEGAALAQVLFAQIDRIDALTQAIEADPSRSPQVIAARLKQQLAVLLDGTTQLDADRLYGEVALLATKADVREEIDRLTTHVAAARDLLQKGGPVGRKLDFLCQEFNREANTICSKSNAAAVTGLGIELKVVIDQFREQVQNLE